MPKGQRDLSKFIDRGFLHWEEFISILSEVSASRLNLFLVKALDPRMSTSEGLTRTETWKEGIRDDGVSYKAEVKFDQSFLVWLFSERFKELQWIDGALIHRNRMDKLNDLIEAHHGKEKEREIEKELIKAAESLVRVGMYDEIDKALAFLKSNQKSEANGKGKAKDKEAITA